MNNLNAFKKANWNHDSFGIQRNGQRILKLVKPWEKTLQNDAREPTKDEETELETIAKQLAGFAHEAHRLEVRKGRIPQIFLTLNEADIIGVDTVIVLDIIRKNGDIARFSLTLNKYKTLKATLRCQGKDKDTHKDVTAKFYKRENL